ncbi:adenosylcobinamide-GDP ribazoletransferase [Phormidium sp. FACHB-1136]|uniref:adenosylcobinamide-GDP ribazoletransferase n=1 Tax=Phormidium sp. FACHB-1136 TaxID=2692848 RepID=UPI00168540B3|nr:adenosylcobinamide-GDP ribazoletransferase [Phormidium sp. FACHB-1136]MBD2425057.1 adenosylcobinamide-GDP ribazoletransferase [Phormidium sp. FACHB-1136]
MATALARLWAQLGGAILFYTILPLPRGWVPQFEGIAALAPWVGVGLGVGLAGVDWALETLGLTALFRSALVVGLWLGLTGGLHLDGAMDTADGLAVQDRDRRLAVMADSHSGAFGVMVAIAILGLKTLALAELTVGRPGGILLAALWGRWGQVVAIARYPYLKATGKGAFHKPHLRLPWALLGGLGASLLTGALWGWLWPDQMALALGVWGGGLALAILVGAWFQRRLGGHTGDTYGATVEWTEVLVLIWAAVLAKLL